MEFFVDGGGDPPHSVTAKLPVDAASKFHTYAGVYDGKTVAIFIDGKSAASMPCKVSPSSNSFELAVGIDTEVTARRFFGSVRPARTVYSARSARH